MLLKPIIPMEPKPYTKPFFNPEYKFQVKWDGVRILLYLQNGKVTLLNKKLRDKTRQYPELQATPAFVKSKQVILDGEMIVLYKGKPSFSRIIERDFAAQTGTIKRLTKLLPVTYILFDILHRDGKDLAHLPWHQRQDMLQEVINDNPSVQLTESFADGLVLFDAVKEQGLEGVVAKKSNSPYVPGKKTDYWLKIKYRQTKTFVVGGYTVKGNRLGALLLGVYKEGKLLYVGRAGSGLAGKEILALPKLLKELELPYPPFSNPPRRGGLKYVWVEPVLTVKVQFDQWTEDLSLRAPVIIGFTKENPENCEL